MSIEKRKDYYRFRITKDGVQYTKNFYGTEKQAEREHENFKVDIRRGNIGDNENMKFVDLSQMVYDEYVKQNCKVRTQIIYKSNYDNHILPEFGTMKIGKIKPIHIQKFANKLSKEYKPNTIDNIIGNLSRTFSLAVEWGILKESPCKNIKTPKPEKRNYEELMSYKEIKKLLDIYEKDTNLMHKSAFYLAIGCGLRNSEIRALTLDDIDFENNVIIINKQDGQKRNKEGKIVDGIITPKTEGSNRKIYAPDFVMVTLRQYIKDLPYIPVTKQIYWSHITRKPISKCCLSKRFTAVLEKNNLSQIRFHDLRHLQGTLLAHSGVDIHAIAGRLGHTKLETTEVYLHKIDEVDKQSVKQFENTIKDIRAKS